MCNFRDKCPCNESFLLCKVKKKNFIVLGWIFFHLFLRKFQRNNSEEVVWGLWEWVGLHFRPLGLLFFLVVAWNVLSQEIEMMRTIQGKQMFTNKMKWLWNWLVIEIRKNKINNIFKNKKEIFSNSDCKIIFQKRFIDIRQIGINQRVRLFHYILCILLCVWVNILVIWD